MNRPVESDQSAGESATMVMGPVALAVTDLERSLSFYENVLGCTLLSRNGNTVALGSDKPLLLLTELRDAAPRSSYTTGLYHVALLLPGRVDLACALRHLLDSGYPVQNMEDHGISEALYLSDPDGNGIELYRDRPRSAWPWHNGKLEATEPSTQLNSTSLLAELDGTEYNWSGLPPSTHIGHIHLRVANLLQNAAFYRDVLGFDESIHGISGACFFATGGYHHHIACNVWTSPGTPMPPSAAPGLRFFMLMLPEQASVMRLVSRCKNAGTPVVQYGQSYLLRDPSGNAIILMAESLQQGQEVMALASVFGNKYDRGNIA